MYQTVFFFPKEVSKCCTITCVYVKDLNYKPKVVNQKSLEPGSWSQDLAYDRKKQRVRAVRVVHHLEENKIVTQKTIYCRTSSYPILKCPSQKSRKEERGSRSEEKQKDTSQEGCAKQPRWKRHYTGTMPLTSELVWKVTSPPQNLIQKLQETTSNPLCSTRLYNGWNDIINLLPYLFTYDLL